MSEQGFFDDIEASDEYTAGKNFVLIPADTVVTAKVTKVEYKTNEETPPTCGFCFFCQERQWGLDNASVYYKEQL